MAAVSLGSKRPQAGQLPFVAGSFGSPFLISLSRSQTPLQESIEPARRLACGALHHQGVTKARAPRARRRFGERQVNQIALRETAAAAMGDVPHVREPLNAFCIVAAGESKQRFAERCRECVFWDEQRCQF
jgi:hypothetical protein